MACIDAALLSRLRLADIESVVFYKRDELTSDLICCDVKVAGDVWTFHEALMGWDLLIDHLNGLPGFCASSFAAILQPPCEFSEAVAFRR